MVCLMHHVPHVPMACPPKAEALYDDVPKGRFQRNRKYAGMVSHMDQSVEKLLGALDELGLSENTVVIFTSDNGGLKNLTSNRPYRGGKGDLYEGGIREPVIIKWPGVIKPGTINNDIYAHEDMLPTLLAAAGVPDVKEQLKKGMKVGNKTFKVHVDGYNAMDAWAGKAKDPRHEFFYFNDDGSLVALRYDQWKIVFQEQRAHGYEVWEEPFVTLRLPKIFNARPSDTGN